MIAKDLVQQVHELTKKGLSANEISVETGIPPTTVKDIRHGRVNSCDKLTTRQRQQLMNTGFQPKENRQ